MRLRIVIFTGIHLIASSSAQAYAKATSATCQAGYTAITSESDCETCIGQATGLTMPTTMAPGPTTSDDQFPVGCHNTDSGYVFNTPAAGTTPLYDCLTINVDCCCKIDPTSVPPPSPSPSPTPSPTLVSTSPTLTDDHDGTVYAEVGDDAWAHVLGATGASAAIVVFCVIANHICFTSPQDARIHVRRRLY